MLVFVAILALPAAMTSQLKALEPHLPFRNVALQTATSPQFSTSMPAGDVEAGKALFTGQRRFQNGGPPCASCHSVATLSFPSGGTMAPDLTHEYSKLGPEGMHYALRTLYFPAMNALFLKRQLTDQEERDLADFFQDADHAQRLHSQTGIFGGAAALGLLVLVGITWMSGRGRVHSVRRKLLRRAGLYRENR
ncbi:MAG: hypothetical protein ACE14M_05440 [Terriglobales bacterium]